MGLISPSKEKSPELEVRTSKSEGPCGLKKTTKVNSRYGNMIELLRC